MSGCPLLADRPRDVGLRDACLARAGRLILLLVLLAFPAGEATAHVRAATAITFAGEELLGKPADTSIAINIVPDAAIVYHYQYGTAPGSYTAQTSDLLASAGQPSELTITGLAPDTRYFYRLRYHLPEETDWVERAEHSFRTQRAAGSTFVFTITSDSHAELNDYYRQATSAIRSDGPDLHLDLGDTFMLDLVFRQEGADRQYLAHRSAAYLGAIGPSTPIFLASGNHENEEGWNLDDASSIALWSIQARKAYYPTPIDDGFYSANLDPLAAIDEAAYGDEYREDYYAWEWGDVLFVVLDPFQYTMDLPYTPSAGERSDDTRTGDQWSWTLGAQQFNWFRQTLENSDAAYKFVFSHQMTGGIPDDYGSLEAGYVRGGARAAAYFEWGGQNADGTPGFAGHRDEAEFGTTPIHQLMVEHRVKAYFHGHDHQYAYELRDGIVYQEVPSPSLSGNEFPGLYPEGDFGDYRTIKVLPGAGYLRLTVTPDQTTVDYVRSDIAGISHSYTIYSDTAPLTLTQLALRQSLDKAAWTPVAGELASSYTVPLDPAQAWYYLDVAELAASHPLADGYYGFLLEQAGLPAGWLAYWAAKGVTADASEPWQQQMWLIINGEAPIFYMKVAGATHMLVDGLGYSLGQPDEYLRVNGDYPLGAYEYTGSLEDVLGNAVTVTAGMAFIGPGVPAAPVVTVVCSESDVTLTWPAVTTDAGGSFTQVPLYQVFVGAEPYFTPDPAPETGNLAAETGDLVYLHASAAGSAGGYFYFVRAVNCVGPSADAAQVGAVTFALIPGSKP